MSIILKGIDMPKYCEMCPFMVMRTDGRWCRTLHKTTDISKNKNDGCPLIEIPTPHGRLIDRDDIYIGRWDIDSDLAEQIHNAPTILEAEEE